MPRARLGVVALLPQPLSTEVDGLRRALRDPARSRMGPHLTLVSPVNVTDRDVPAAVEVLRRAAAASSPQRFELGPAATFAGDGGVVYLRVGGDLEALGALRTALRRGPLERAQHHDPWVPHVTVAAALEPRRVPAVLDALEGFAATTEVSRVHLMVQGRHQTWQPLADAGLGGAPATSGRGGVELTVTESARPGPEAAAVAELDGPGGRPFALTAHSGSEVVAMAWGWTSGDGLVLADLVVAGAHRGRGIGRRLLVAVEDLGRRRGCLAGTVLAPAEGPAGSVLAGAGWSLVEGAAASPPGPSRWRTWSRAW